MNKKKALKQFNELLRALAGDHAFLQKIGAEEKGSFPTSMKEFKKPKKRKR